MKKIIFMLVLLMLFSAFISGLVFAQNTASRIIDEAKLLTEGERNTLSQKISKIAVEYNYDIVIVTTNSVGDKSPMAYADDFYNYNNYGYGEGKDGMLFLISMTDRDWWISTHGYGIQVFTDYRLKQMEDKIIPHLSNGNYYNAFDAFLNLSENHLMDAKAKKLADVPLTGKSQDYFANNYAGNQVDIPLKDKKQGYLLSMLAGLIVALIVVSCQKAGMKSVLPAINATSYLSSENLDMNRCSDIFLYVNVVMHETSNSSSKSSFGSSSGVSTTHRSSSGSTHGGRGGKF